MDLDDSFSVGVDIVNIQRISKNIDDSDNFIIRAFSKEEIKYCNSKQNPSFHFAGKLAGKEAVSKALEMTWDEGIVWKDIEILNDKKNLPKVFLHGQAKNVANKRKIRNIKISISHEKDYAIAFVMISGRLGYE